MRVEEAVTGHDSTFSVVSVARSLWASVQGHPKFMLRLNGWLTVFWIVMIPISFRLWLVA